MINKNLHTLVQKKIIEKHTVHSAILNDLNTFLSLAIFIFLES